MKKTNFQFDVALSFAGEDRVYVEEVASILKKMGIRVFYDKYETASLWGKDLYTHLQEVYSKLSKYTVMFLSKNYKKKLWTNRERESAQARAFTEKGEYILPARFDSTEIPGILPTTGYIDIKDYSPQEFAQLIKNKLGPFNRKDFYPNNPDRLISYLEDIEVLEVDDPEAIEEIDEDYLLQLSNNLFEMFKLMTAKERRVIIEAYKHACPNGLPHNIHLRIDYLERTSRVKRDEIVSILSRLQCLDIESRMYESHPHGDAHSLNKSYDIIEITYEFPSAGYNINATPVILAIFNCIFDHACPDCARKALERADFSLLGILTGFDEVHLDAGALPKEYRTNSHCMHFPDKVV